MPRRNNGPKLVWLDKRKTYYIRWTEGGRSRERSTGTADLGQAQAVLAEALNERQKRSGPADASDVLVTDVLADYGADRAASATAAERISYALPPLIKFWVGKTVGDVSRQSCDAYRRYRNRSDGTVRRELGVLRAAINHAFAESRISRKVAVHLPERPEPKDRWLTKAEAAGLLLASLRLPNARLYLPLYIAIGLHGGARRDAILSLTWQQVDLDAGVIDWNPPGRARTKKRRVKVRIPPKLLGHLHRARLRGEEDGYVVHRDGKRLKDIKKAFSSACKRAGLVGVTSHTMRHTRATWGMQAGASKWELAGFLGMSLETLETVYGHHHPDYQREASEVY